MKRVPLDPAAVAISFDCPTRAWSARIEGPTVNLYLFDLRENVPLRQGGPAQERGAPGPNGHIRSRWCSTVNPMSSSPPSTAVAYAAIPVCAGGKGEQNATFAIALTRPSGGRPLATAGCAR